MQRLMERLSDWIVGEAKIIKKKETKTITLELNLNRPWKFIILYYNVFQFEVGIFHYFVVNICLLSSTDVLIFLKRAALK